MTTTRYLVREVEYTVYRKHDARANARATMRVRYLTESERVISEWIAFEHGGMARERASAWWHRRSNRPLPTSASAAVAIAQSGGLLRPRAITVERAPGDRYDTIVDCELGLPPYRGQGTYEQGMTT